MRNECEAMIKHFGRIALSDILAQWSDSHPSNPRFLASEVAAVLRSLMPDSHVIDARHVGVIHPGQTYPDASLTVSYEALAEYFDTASTGPPANAVNGTDGPLPASSLTIHVHWLDVIVKEATSRMAYVGALVAPVNQSTRITLVAGDRAPAPDCMPLLDQPSGSSPGYMKMRQAQLRNYAERNVFEELGSLDLRHQKAEQRVAELLATLAMRDARIAQQQEEEAQLRRSLSEAIRAKQETEDELIRIEEMLEPHMLAIEFLNPENHLSPPEVREMFSCWRWLSDDNSREPVKATSRGMDVLCREWFSAQKVEVTDKKVGRFATGLTTTARKRGGAVARE